MGVVGSADVAGAEVERIVERPQGAGEVLLELAAEAIAASRVSGEVALRRVSARFSPPAGRVVMEMIPPVAPLP